MTNETGRRLDDFLGSWWLERRIAHDDGSDAQFDGRAEWRVSGDGAICRESGLLTLAAGHRLQAERRYRWDHGLRVYFEDGRFFHTVPPAGGEATHDCPPDRYAARYDFTAWPDWSCTWRVDGPRKGYVLHNRFRRVAA